MIKHKEFYVDLNSVGATVDSLGEVKAQIATLKRREQELRSRIERAAAVTERQAFEGVYFRATVVTSIRHGTNWRQLATDLALSELDLEPYTTETETTTVRCVARTGETS